MVVTKRERIILAKAAIKFTKAEYWLNEVFGDGKNLEQQHASLIEADIDHRAGMELLTKLEPQIMKGVKELASGSVKRR